MRHSTALALKPTAMKADSPSQHILPPTGRRTPWTRHFKRASSIATDFDTASPKEVAFSFAPEPLKVITNDYGSAQDENILDDFPAKSSLLLPAMSDNSDADVQRPKVALRPALRLNYERRGCATDSDSTRPYVSTPTPTMGLPETPSAPRKDRKRMKFIDVDFANAPASIFLPEGL